MSREQFIENGGHAVCLHNERWDIILQKLEAIEKQQSKFNERLFIGNGTPAMNVTVQKHDQVLNALVWTTGTLVAAMIVAGVGLTIRAIFKGLGG